jgi:hypothetical protein
MATLDEFNITEFGYPPNNNWLWLGLEIAMTILSIFIYSRAKTIILKYNL